MGMLIKDEILQTPTLHNKYLWNGHGLWAKEYDFCVECGMHLYKHKGHGTCIRCYTALRYQANKDAMKKQVKKWREVNREKSNNYKRKRANQAREIIRRVNAGEIQRTPVIDNIIETINKVKKP